MKYSAETIGSPTIDKFCLFSSRTSVCNRYEERKTKRNANLPADSSLPHSIHNSCKRGSFLLLGNLLLNTVLHFKFDTMAGS
jgi:hypothetical protein